MFTNTGLRFSMAGTCAQQSLQRQAALPAATAQQEYQVLFGALLAFFAGSTAVALHALAFLGQ